MLALIRSWNPDLPMDFTHRCRIATLSGYQFAKNVLPMI
jgi:hypothetical protein